jgi:hypothetical protein
MLQLDRNQHPATLSPPLISDKDQPQILSWSAISRDSLHKEKPAAVQNLETSPASTLTPPPENPSSPSPQTAGNVSTTEPTDVANTSRQSTPLSDLSSPSEVGDSPRPEPENGVEQSRDGENVKSSGAADPKDGGAKVSGDEPRAVQPSGHPAIDPHSAKETTPENKYSQPPDSAAPSPSPSIPTPSSATSPAGSLSSSKLDTKVVTILELNAELLKCATISFNPASLTFKSQGCDRVPKSWDSHDRPAVQSVSA